MDKRLQARLQETPRLSRGNPRIQELATPVIVSPAFFPFCLRSMRKLYYFPPDTERR